ncbi:N-acetylmuramoyl-L-alanine amidase family protein [Cellulosilyticum sp. I15G10I2]|uniref:N-acetylmuramoyl-L-alanine amidase family protein n=1 Tax=Cellulosilyticum sp. I15G10I2 TaxID=1892843 RepID=UPI00085C3FEC|nr:N-acetylmuramoyl-L-alanine amidase [Cellulosilyticum sp. I15G10I2]
MDVRESLGFTPLLILDGGHGITTPERRTPPLPDGRVIQEYEFNKAVVALADLYARQLGFATYITSPDETDTPLAERVERANRAYQDHRAELQRQGIDTTNLDIATFVSVHYNILGTEYQTRAQGVETFYYPTSTRGQRLARNLQAALLRGTPQVDRGAKPANFYVLRRTQMPAALIEPGFMDYAPEAILMGDPAFRDEVAREVVEGVLQYYGITYRIE